jgi:L-asparaginase II
LPELGLGFAVKADDGATRAAQAMIAALIGRFLSADGEDCARLAPFAAPVLRNWRTGSRSEACGRRGRCKRRAHNGRRQTRRVG